MSSESTTLTPKSQDYLDPPDREEWPDPPEPRAFPSPVTLPRPRPRGVDLPIAVQKEAAGIYTIQGLRKLAAVRRPFLIEHLLAEGSANILIGDSGLGKTPLLIQMGLCVSAGVPFLGHRVVQGPVLYVDGESNLHEFIETIERISAYLGIARVPDAFEVWSPNFDVSPSVLSLDKQLEAKVRLACPTLVIVDTQRVFWPDAEAKTANAMEMYQTQQSLTKEIQHRTKETQPIQPTWLTAHHVRKVDRTGKNPVSLATDGHRWFQEASGVKALITRPSTRLGVESTNQINADLVFGGWLRGTGWFEPRYLARVRDDQGEEIGYKLLEGPGALNNSYQQVYLGLPDPFSYTVAKQALGGKSDSNTVSFLKQCETAKLIQKAGKCYLKLWEGA